MACARPCALLPAYIQKGCSDHSLDSTWHRSLTWLLALRRPRQEDGQYGCFICLSYCSISVMRHCSQGNLRKKAYNMALTYSIRAWLPDHSSRKHGSRRASIVGNHSWDVTHLIPRSKRNPDINNVCMHIHTPLPTSLPTRTRTHTHTYIYSNIFLFLGLMEYRALFYF